MPTTSPWACPRCDPEFKNKNQAHSCFSVKLEDHFRSKSPQMKETHEKLIVAVRKHGPVTIQPVKTAIQVKAPSTFLSVKVKKDRLEIEFQLGREVVEPPVYRTLRVSMNRVVHLAVLESPRDVSKKLIAWLRESYAVVSGRAKGQ